VALPPDLSRQFRTKAGGQVIRLGHGCANIPPLFGRRAVACLVAAVLLFVPWLPAQQDERAVRAAFVFNLTKYVSWPVTRDRLVIGVVGPEQIGSMLKQVLDGKVSDGRRITVIMHSPDAELSECDVLYVSGVPLPTVRSVLNRAANRAVLTVGDSEQFVRTGGMVGLVRSGDQMEIEVNLPALRGRQLDMSSRLLKLAVLLPSDGGLR